MKKRKLLFVAVIIFSLIISVVAYQFLFPKKEYAVSTSDPYATKVGMDVLKNGGTAVDAAIAISYALGVVEPYGSGVGGGGGMLIDPADGDSTFIDYREVAPNSDKDEQEGVPGFVAGMEYIHQNYATKPMGELMNPAISYARDGFKVDQDLHDRLVSYQKNLDEDELEQFYPNEEAIKAGEILKQKDLAKTLTAIKEEGASAFYRGDIGDELADETEISKKDLRDYEAIERKPLETNYKGNRIISAPPPFSGVTLIQMLKLADEEKIWELKGEKPSLFNHYLGEISKVTYQDRLDKVADPSFIKQAPEDWIDDRYVHLLGNKINETRTKKTKVSDVEEHESTTHFVVIDKEGTVVSTTNTLSNFFGSGKNVEGFFLNNTLGTFGEGINKIEEGKRPRTFTAPTIIRGGDDEWVMGIGTPGGNRIPQVLTQVLGNYFDGGQSIDKAVQSSRVIFDSDKLYPEKEPENNVKDRLKTYGYDVKENDNPMFYGGVQALIQDRNEHTISGSADKRRHGLWDKSTE